MAWSTDFVVPLPWRFATKSTIKAVLKEEKTQLLGLFTVRNSLLAITGVTTALLVWLAAGYWLGAQTQRTDAIRLLRRNEVEDLLLASADYWAVERGLAHLALNMLGPVPDADRRAIKVHRESANAAFIKVLAQLRGTLEAPSDFALLEAAEGRYAEVEALREQIDGLVENPFGPRSSYEYTVSARESPVLVALDEWFPAVTELIMAAQRLRVAVRYRAQEAVREIEALQDLKHAVWLMREFAERERTLIGGMIASDDPLITEDLENLSAFRGRLEQAWMAVEAYGGQEGASPIVVAEIDHARESYFDAFEQVRAPIVTAVMNQQPYPVSAAEWYAQSGGAIAPLRRLGNVAGEVATDLTAAREADGARQRVIATVVLLAAAGLAAFSFWIVVGHIVRPLARITNAMTTLSGGDETVAVPGTERQGEIGTMARAVQVFKETMEEKNREIRQSHERVEGLYAQVSRHAENLAAKVKERTSELEETNRELENASRHKSEFLANMSHELRTPLNAIIGYTELIEDKIYGEVSEKIGDVIERVEQNGRHLLLLINDILDLSKIEAGQLTLSLDDYSMDDVVHTVITGVEPLAVEKNLALTTSLGDHLPVARGDEQRITQALMNLVGNAIKFTDAGEVKVQVETSNGSFLVSVSDTGVGIAKADQEKIFEEFQQADGSDTRRQGGTGLGLAITRRMIEMHGGRIWVESNLGEGSTFWLSFPVRVDQQAEGT